MLGRTHLVTGLFVGLLLVSFFSITSWGEAFAFVLITMLGSLFPDIDSPKSLIGRRFKIISKIFKHRGFFHSAFALLLFYLLFKEFIGWTFAVGFSAGFFSHLLLDTLTKDGLKIFPFRAKLRGPCRTGGFLEHAFILLQLFFIVVLFVG